MKITLSKQQWEFVGKKTGWIKTAQIEPTDTNEITERTVQFISKAEHPYLVDDLIGELEKYRGLAIVVKSEESGIEGFDKKNAPIIGLGLSGKVFSADPYSKQLFINLS